METFKIGVAGKSAIKLNAVKAAIASLGGIGNRDVVIVSIPEAESSVGEQPIGDVLISLGARQRVLSAYRIDPSCDYYIGIENGIRSFETSNSAHPYKYYDVASCCLFIPLTIHALIQYTDACEFPAEAVHKTRQKEGGFAKNTVGKTLQEMGIVKQHDDPHLDLMGVSRQELLTSALKELLVRGAGLRR